MLILLIRKVSKPVIVGNDIAIEAMKFKRGQGYLRFKAPSYLTVCREEISHCRSEENKQNIILILKTEQPRQGYTVGLPLSHRKNTLFNNNDINNNRRVEDLYLGTALHLSNPSQHGSTDYRQEPLTQTRLSGGRQKEGPAREEQTSSFPLTRMEKVLDSNTKDSITQTIQKSMLWHKKPFNPLISVGFLAGLFEGKRSECIQINLTRRIDGC